jgi:hypothetical protein
MAFQLSPGVNVTEKDVTLIVPAVATTPGAMVGPFQWGPANERTIIGSEKELSTVFGGPLSSLTEGIVADYATYWFTAANFLAYGNNLQIVRMLSENYKTATNTYEIEDESTDGISSTTGYPVSYNVSTGKWTGIFNEESTRDFIANYSTNINNNSLIFSARYPGLLGNSLKVVVIDSGADFDQTSDGELLEYSKFFNTTPGTSAYVESITGRDDVNDEIHVLVIDDDGLWTGVKGSVLERFEYISKALDGRKPDGTNNYWINIINNNSQYIYAYHAPTVSSGDDLLAWGSSALSINSQNSFGIVTASNKYQEFVLAGGSLEGSQWTDGAGTVEDEIEGFYEEHFDDAETSDVSLLLAGPVSASVAARIIEIAENRKDCIAFVSPKPDTGSPETMNLTDILEYRSDLTISSSYGVMDSGYKLQYDRYNDVFRYVPLCGDVAGCCVRTDTTRDPWFSPAGFDRGRIQNVIRLAFNPNKTSRDELYRKGINPVVAFEGEGTVLYGDKTLLSRPSAFDRINVRRLFIVLEKAIATASKFLLFEFNDDFTRAQFRNLVEPYLRDVQGRRGITDFRVVCDETNNTAQVIDSNSFVGDIYIKPTRSINFIQLNFIATPTGVSFEEIQGV